MRIVLVSSNTFLCLGLRQTVELHQGLVVVGECLWAVSARALVEQERPDLIVVDLELDMNQSEVVTMLRESAPAAKIVLLTGWADMGRSRQALEAGADVIMMKCQPPSILLAIIDSMIKNFSPSAAPARSSKPDGLGMAKPFLVPTPNRHTLQALTERERAVVGLVGQGLSNRDIAERLCISDTTVRHHLTNVFAKLGVQNRQKLLLLAHQSGLTGLQTQA